MTTTAAEAERRRGFASTVLRHPALPAFVGMLVVWIAIVVLAGGRGWWGTFDAGVIVATFLVIAGLGQLLVITVGNGGIDLSVSYVITLSSFFACDIMRGTDANLVWGIVVAIIVGLGVGIVNAVLIEVVGMPPLVGTLAVGFTLQTIALIYSGSVVGVASPSLRALTTMHWGPIPVLGVIGIAVAVIFYVVLKRTGYGRRIEAVGQNAVAAGFAGTRPALVRASAYVISGGMAGVAGVLLAAYSGGPSLNLGDTYQLASIAVVVLGGSLIAGGRGIVSGLWAGAVLLTLLSTLGAVTHLSSGWQFIIQGGLIVLVLSLTRNPGDRR